MVENKNPKEARARPWGCLWCGAGRRAIGNGRAGALGRAGVLRGVYELDAPAGETTVAVKVTDMLGEEVLKLIAFSMGDNEM